MMTESEVVLEDTLELRNRFRFYQTQIEEKLGQLNSIGAFFAQKNADTKPAVVGSSFSTPNRFVDSRAGVAGRGGGEEDAIVDGDGDREEQVQRKLTQMAETRTQITACFREAETALRQLSRSVSSDGSAPSSSAHMKRLQKILDCLKTDFRLTNEKVNSNFQRFSLRSSAVSSRRLFSDSQAAGEDCSASKDLLRERNALDSSITVVDELLTQGRQTQDQLRKQRTRFGNMSRKLTTLGHDYLPSVGNLMNKIHRVKCRHTTVLACTVGLCLLFLLWWIFRPTFNRRSVSSASEPSMSGHNSATAAQPSLSAAGKDAG